MSNIGCIHKRGPSTLVYAVQIHLRSEKANRHWMNKVYTKRNETGLASITHFWMHSATTSYWPMEQAVCRSRGTSSSSAWTRESPSHRERLEPSCSDSLASSLNSDIFQDHTPKNTTTFIKDNTFALYRPRLYKNNIYIKPCFRTLMCRRWIITLYSC